MICIETLGCNRCIINYKTRGSKEGKASTRKKWSKEVAEVEEGHG